MIARSRSTGNPVQPRTRVQWQRQPSCPKNLRLLCTQFYFSLTEPEAWEKACQACEREKEPWGVTVTPEAWDLVGLFMAKLPLRLWWPQVLWNSAIWCIFLYEAMCTKFTNVTNNDFCCWMLIAIPSAFLLFCFICMYVFVLRPKKKLLCCPHPTKIWKLGRSVDFFFLRTVRELSFPIFFLKFLNGENSGGMQSKRISKCFFRPLNTNFSKFFAQIWHKKKKKKKKKRTCFVTFYGRSGEGNITIFFFGLITMVHGAVTTSSPVNPLNSWG